MLSSSYSFTPHTEIGKIQCIVHGFPQSPLQSQSHLCRGCPALLKDLRGQTGKKSESSPHQWGFSRHSILLLFCSRSMEDTQPLYVLVAMLNCSFSNLILPVRVEHWFPSWSHPAGTSCILRFSSPLAFQKPGPKSQPQRVLCWDCPLLFLISSSTHEWYDDVSDGPYLRILPLLPFSLLYPSSLFGTWSLSGLGQNLLWVTRISSAITSPIPSSLCYFISLFKSHFPTVPSLPSLSVPCTFFAIANSFLSSHIELKSLGVLGYTVFQKTGQGGKCLSLNRPVYCSWNDINSFYCKTL